MKCSGSGSKVGAVGDHPLLLPPPAGGANRPAPGHPAALRPAAQSRSRDGCFRIHGAPHSLLAPDQPAKTGWSGKREIGNECAPLTTRHYIVIINGVLNFPKTGVHQGNPHRGDISAIAAIVVLRDNLPEDAIRLATGGKGEGVPRSRGPDHSGLSIGGNGVLVLASVVGNRVSLIVKGPFIKADGLFRDLSGLVILTTDAKTAFQTDTCGGAENFKFGYFLAYYVQSVRPTHSLHAHKICVGGQRLCRCRYRESGKQQEGG